MENKANFPVIGIVGVCASGKTTLNSGLIARGYNSKHIAQEHSYVPDMWRRMTNPDILIYLDVSYENTIKRKLLNWTREEYLEQVHRIHNAAANAQIHIDTNSLDAVQLVEKAILEISKILNNR
jgi:deoxyadenosine/deoxycytidine kinase